MGGGELTLRCGSRPSPYLNLCKDYRITLTLTVICLDLNAIGYLGSAPVRDTFRQFNTNELTLTQYLRINPNTNSTNEVQPMN